MLTLKIMSSQDLPDDNPCKNFTLVQLTDDDVLSFHQCDSEEKASYYAEVIAVIARKDGSAQEYPLTGNAYVMNVHGKTISHRASY